MTPPQIRKGRWGVPLRPRREEPMMKEHLARLLAWNHSDSSAIKFHWYYRRGWFRPSIDLAIGPIEMGAIIGAVVLAWWLS